MLNTGEFQQRAEILGDRLAAGLGELVGQGVDEVRARGLWAGVDISPELGTGRHVCEQLLDQGVLAKEAHGQTVRLAPPLRMRWAAPHLEGLETAAVAGAPIKPWLSGRKARTPP